MSMPSPRLVLLGLFVVLASTPLAHADRAAGFAASEEYAPPQTRVGPGAGAPRLRVAPPPVFDSAELRAALERSRVDVQGCLVQGLPGRASVARVRVRLDRAGRLTISLTLRPDDRDTRACVDLAFRRWVQPMQSRPIGRVLTASIVVRNGRPIPPPPHHPPPHHPPPHHPPPHHPPPDQYDEAQVHAALDAMRASLIECVPDVSAGIVGRITLRVSVHPDGSMTLIGVDLPSGVRGPGSLPCLAGRITWLRVASPPGDRTVVHHVELGR